MSCPIFPPQQTPCGNYGTCVVLGNSTAFCKCQPGYSSFGDFSIASSNPCDINLIAIQVLWGVMLVGTACTYGMSAWGILSRKQAGKLQWKAWRLWIVPYLAIVQTSLCFAIAIGKLVDPETWIIGKSYPATIIHGLVVITAITYMIVGLAGVARTAHADGIRGKSSSDQLKMQIKMRRLETAIGIFWVCAAVCAFVPMAAVVNPDHIFWVAGVQGCGLAFEMIVLGVIIAPKQFQRVLDRVQESVKANATKTGSNAKMLKVVLKMRVARRLALVGFTVSAVAILIVSLWPYMVLKVAYSLPLFYLVIHLAACSLIWITTTTNALDLRRPSMALKRLSLALASGPLGRKSVEKRIMSAGHAAADTPRDASMLPIVASPGPTPDF